MIVGVFARKYILIPLLVPGVLCDGLLNVYVIRKREGRWNSGHGCK